MFCTFFACYFDANSQAHTEDITNSVEKGEKYTFVVPSLDSPATHTATDGQKQRSGGVRRAIQKAAKILRTTQIRKIPALVRDSYRIFRDARKAGKEAKKHAKTL